jgi:hypothetical protein
MTRPTPADEACLTSSRNALGAFGEVPAPRRRAVPASAASVPLLHWLAEAGKTSSGNTSSEAANAPLAHPCPKVARVLVVLHLRRVAGRWVVTDPATRRAIRCRLNHTKRDAVALWRLTYNQRTSEVRILKEQPWNLT